MTLLYISEFTWRCKHATTYDILSKGCHVTEMFLDSSAQTEIQQEFNLHRKIIFVYPTDDDQHKVYWNK